MSYCEPMTSGWLSRNGKLLFCTAVVLSLLCSSIIVSGRHIVSDDVIIHRMLGMLRKGEKERRKERKGNYPILQSGQSPQNAWQSPHQTLLLLSYVLRTATTTKKNARVYKLLQTTKCRLNEMRLPS